MILLRKLLLYIVLLLTALVLVAGIAVSGIGSATLVRMAVEQVPELEVEDISGGLSSTLIAKGIGYRNDTLDANIEQLTLTLKWRCFLQFALCADTLIIDGAEVTQNPTSEPKSPEYDGQQEIIRLPALVTIDQLIVNKVRYVQPESISVELTQLSTEVRAYQRIRLIGTDINGVTVTQLDNSQPADEEIEALKDIALPLVHVPLALDLERLHVTNATLRQPNRNINNLALSTVASIAGSDVQVQSLQFQHSMGSITASGSLSTAQDYPVDLSIQFNGQLNSQLDAKATIDLSGSLSELIIDAAMTHPANAELSGTAKPLSAQRELDMTSRWQPFSLATFTDAEAFRDARVQSGEVQVKGNWQDYAVLLTTQVSVPQLPTAADIALRATANVLRAEIEQLQVSALEGEIHSSGELFYADSLNWHIKTQVNQIKPMLLGDNLPTQLSGQLEYDGQWFNDALNINVPNLSIEATQQDQPLEATGSAAFAGNVGVAVSSLTIAHRQNRVQGFVRVLTDRRVDADLIVAINEIADTLPIAAGSARGNILVFGDIHNPSVEGQFDINQLRLVDGEKHTAIADTASLKIAGDSQCPAILAKLENPQSSLDLAIEIERQHERWIVTPQHWDMRYQDTLLSLESADKLALTLADMQASVDQICWRSSRNSSLCLTELEYQDQMATGQAAIANLAIEDLQPLLLNPLPITSETGRLNASVTGGYHPSSGLQFDLFASVDQSVWQASDSQYQQTWSLDALKASLRYQQSQATFDFGLESTALGDVDARGVLTNVDNSDRPSINAQLSLSALNLAPFALLSEDINQLQGIANAELTLSGELTKPVLEGQFKLESDVVDIKHAPAVLTDWNADVVFERQGARFDSTYTLGQGAGIAKGTIAWQPTLALDIKVQGENLTTSHQNIDLQLSPDLTLRFAENNLSIEGSLAIPQGMVKVDSLPKSAVVVSNDVHLRGEPPPTSLVRTAHMDVTLNIDPETLGNVRIDAFGLESNLQGQLQLKNQPSLSGFGTLSIGDGEYRAYGQELLIRTGEIQFNGPLTQPLLYVEAIRDPDLTDDNVVAGIRIDGIANQPNVEIFSEPGLNQAQALAYLLTGSGDPTSDSSGDGNYAGLLFGLGVSSSETLTNNVGKALGIEQLRLQTKGSGDDTQITVSGKLSDDLTIEYGVGVSDAPSEVRLRYQLQPRLYLEAISGYYNSLLLYYRFSRGSVTSTDTESSVVTETPTH